jgi:hypothetical protein
LPKIEDLVGLELGDAEKIASGLEYEIDEIIVTSPPRYEKGGYDLSFRVIRVRETGNKKISLLVCKPL